MGDTEEHTRAEAQDPYAIVSETTDEDEFFVKVWKDEATETSVELPKEENETIMLTTLQGQFPGAVGLKYKSSTGGWRGVRITENALKPPQGGWREIKYYVTVAKGDPVKASVHNEKPKVSGKPNNEELKQDLFVINLAPEVTDEDMKEYFTKACGEMELNEVKYDRQTGKSRGFGFIRFKSGDASREALNGEHSIAGEKLEIRVSRKKVVPCQLFVGRLPEGSTKEDLLEHFSQYGEVTDAYITSPFRGFGFVTYADTTIARQVLRKSHEIKTASLNVAVAEPKDERGRDNRRRDDYRRGGSDHRRHDDGYRSRDGERDRDSERERDRRDRSRHDRDYRGDHRSNDDMMNEFKGMLFEMMNERRR